MESLIFKDTTHAQEILQKYPWFDAACRFLSNTGQETPARIILIERYRPRKTSDIIPENTVEFEDSYSPEETETDTMSIIDDFIEKKEYRIRANDSTPEDLELSESEDILPQDELLTEELAEVYMAQGLTAQAVEIYHRLSLLNPEKSVYFAEIIAKASSSQDARIKLTNK